MNEQEHEEYLDDYMDDDDVCPICGAHEYDPDSRKCPDCRPCGGMFSPGTEECDFCPDEDICSKSFR